MARLWVKSNGEPVQPCELKLGLNRIGRHADNDFQIDHPTVSSLHCEILLGDNSLTVRDRNSTNGTYVDGHPVKEATLSAGQVLQLGEVEVIVETTEVAIAIPKLNVPQETVSKTLADGSLTCTNHPDKHAIGKCKQCGKVFCGSCIHELHRVGGRHWRLCPICSGRCVPLPGFGKKKKKNFLKRLGEKLKLPFKRKKETRD